MEEATCCTEFDDNTEIKISEQHNTNKHTSNIYGTTKEAGWIEQQKQRKRKREVEEKWMKEDTKHTTTTNETQRKKSNNKSIGRERMKKKEKSGPLRAA